MQWTDEDKFFQRDDVKEWLLSRSISNGGDKGLTIDFEISAEEILRLIEICQKEKSFKVPSGLTREERRQWALSKIDQDDAMNELVTLSEDLGLYNDNSAVVVSDSSLMTVERARGYAELFSDNGEVLNQDMISLPYNLDKEGMRKFIIQKAKED